MCLTQVIVREMQMAHKQSRFKAPLVHAKCLEIKAIIYHVVRW